MIDNWKEINFIQTDRREFYEKELVDCFYSDHWSQSDRRFLVGRGLQPVLERRTDGDARRHPSHEFGGAAIVYGRNAFPLSVHDTGRTPTIPGVHA